MNHREAIMKKRQLLEQLGEIDKLLDGLRTKNQHIAFESALEWESHQNVHTNDVPLRHAEAVGPQLGFNALAMRASFLEVPPNASEGNNHRHGETIKLYLSGSGIEAIEGVTYEVSAGDVVFTPANAWHTTKNAGDEPLRIFQVSQALGTHVQVPVIREYTL